MMRGILKNLVIVASLLLTVINTFAGDVRMSIEPNVISLLDRAVLKITFVDTKGEAADIPDIDGLNISYQGKSSQYSIVNGNTSSSVIHTYLITPTKVGDYTIGPASVKFKGGEKQLSAKLRVIKPDDDAEAQQISQKLFSRISTPHPNPFVQEPFELDLKVYVRDDVQIVEKFGIQGGMPESGLDGEVSWKTAGLTHEEVKGTSYSVYLFHGTAKTLTSGVFTFRPEVQLQVVVPRQQRRSFGFDDPFFGDFFGRQETRPIVLDCNGLDVDVKPIPMEGRPASYTGGVGVLDFDVTVGPTQLKAGEPVTVKMRISGSGNLEKITPPSVEDKSDIKLYDVRSVPTDKPDEVLFEQVIIPTSDSIKEIPVIPFSYFNTQTADFRTITKGPFPITVEAGPQRAAQVMSSVPQTGPQEAKVLGHDIAYLKSAPGRWETIEDSVFEHTLAFRLLMVLPALILSITGITVAQRNRLAKDVALARRQKAPKAARRNIQLAEHAIKNNEAAAFNEAMWNALVEYFGHRFNLAPGQVTLSAIRQRIPGEADTIAHLFDTIEHRRYGIREADSNPEQMKKLLQQLVETLKKCERMKR